MSSMEGINSGLLANKYNEAYTTCEKLGVNSQILDEKLKANPLAGTEESAYLEVQLEETEKKQGNIGKAWNGFKKIFNVGLSDKDAKEKINEFKKGNTSFDEAKNTVLEYKQKQESAVDLITSLGTGVVVAGTVAATGGLSLGALATGAGAGAAAKTTMKAYDRATNDTEWDALDNKQLARDAISGAVDGAVTAATAGTAKAAGQGAKTMGEAVKQGAIQGVKQGAKAGAVMNASNYAIDAAFEDDTQFSAQGLLGATAEGAISGALVGGVLGGASGGHAFSKANSAGAAVEETGLSVVETPVQGSAGYADDVASAGAKSASASEASSASSSASAQNASSGTSASSQSPVGYIEEQSPVPRLTSSSGAKSGVDYDSMWEKFNAGVKNQKGDALKTKAKNILKEAIDAEGNSRLSSAYSEYSANPTSQNLSKLQRAVAKAFHPDSSGGDDSAMSFYNALIGILKK